MNQHSTQFVDTAAQKYSVVYIFSAHASATIQSTSITLTPKCRLASVCGASTVSSIWFASQIVKIFSSGFVRETVAVQALTHWQHFTSSLYCPMSVHVLVRREHCRAALKAKHTSFVEEHRPKFFLCTKKKPNENKHQLSNEQLSQTAVYLNVFFFRNFGFFLVYYYSEPFFLLADTII